MSVEPPTNPTLLRGIDRALSVQRPVVLAHIRAIRQRRPNATPDEVIRVLEFRYLAAVTTGGAAVGASAVIPAVGIAASVALSSVETVGFLEASALFAQSVTEVHGIAVEDPDRARALVMTMMLGSGGSDLVRQLAGEVTGKGPTRSGFWGNMVTKSLPSSAMNHIADRIKHTFLKRFVVTQGTNVVGRMIPFGIGAVVGGSGNNILGRKVVKSSREAFGPAPVVFPAELEPRLATLKLPREPKAAKPEKPAKAIKAPKQPKPPKPGKTPRVPRGDRGWIEDSPSESDTGSAPDYPAADPRS